MRWIFPNIDCLFFLEAVVPDGDVLAESGDPEEGNMWDMEDLTGVVGALGPGLDSVGLASDMGVGVAGLASSFVPLVAAGSASTGFVSVSIGAGRVVLACGVIGAVSIGCTAGLST